MMKEKFGFLMVWLLCLTACSSDKATIVDLQFTNDLLLPHTPVRNQGRTQTCVGIYHGIIGGVRLVG